MSEWTDRDEYNIPDDKHHPSADDAMAWLKAFMFQHPIEYGQIKESIYSTALSGNDLANYCAGTIERLAAGQPVSDRYLLGLAWTVRSIADGRATKYKATKHEAA